MEKKWIQSDDNKWVLKETDTVFCIVEIQKNINYHRDEKIY